MNKSSLTEFSICVGKCCSINLENISLHSDTKPASGCPDLLCSLSRLAWNEKSTCFHSILRHIKFLWKFSFKLWKFFSHLFERLSHLPLQLFANQSPHSTHQWDISLPLQQLLAPSSPNYGKWKFWYIVCTRKRYLFHALPEVEWYFTYHNCLKKRWCAPQKDDQILLLFEPVLSMAAFRDLLNSFLNDNY